jgi:transcriptional regulator with XRE-family HTH domain
VQGRRLRQLRKRAGLTQFKVAAITGLMPGTIVRLEREDGSNPQLATLEALAKALGCTVPDLLAEPDPEPSKAAG